MFSKRRFLNRTICVVVMLMAMGVPIVLAAPSARSEKTSEILKWTSSGHVLGFHSSGVYVATGSYMLRERFIGAKEKSPQTGPPISKNGRSQPLEMVSYHDLWEGITLNYDRPPGGILRSTYRVRPWANPDQITLQYNVPVRMGTSGSLVFKFDTGAMIAGAPVAWQEIDGTRIPVDVTFRLNRSQSTVQFSLGYYNPARSLIIDPTLSWNTFMGGSGSSDRAEAIAVDGNGNVYVAGSSAATWGSPVNAHTAGAGNFDAFAAKLNSSGETVWNTFMGSTTDDRGYAIAVDGSGNVYVTGASDFNWGSPVNPHAGGLKHDAFVAKLNSSGETVWNTFMGSTDEDYGYGIAVDGDQNVYVAGSSVAAWGSPVNPHTDYYDVFAAKLNINGETEWSTFMGSEAYDDGTAIALDDTGHVYVAGRSAATWGHPVNAHAGGDDVFAAKLNNSGETVWNTFMGSDTYEYGYGITVDGSGNVYVVGASDATWGSPVNGHTGGSDNYDVFVAKLSSSGVRQWNTFMGSASYDFGYGIAVGRSRSVYVTGKSADTWGSPENDHSGGPEDDAFVAMLNSSGKRHWHTFMGASGNSDSGNAIAVDGNGNAYVTGNSGDTWGSPVNDHAGLGSDAFAARFLKSASLPLILLLL